MVAGRSVFPLEQLKSVRVAERNTAFVCMYVSLHASDVQPLRDTVLLSNADRHSVRTNRSLVCFTNTTFLYVCRAFVLF